VATLYWISTSSTSFNTAGNWSTGAAPSNGDTVIFNYLGTANCSTNLGTSLTTVTLIVEKSYTGTIGSISGATWTYLVLDGGTLHYHPTTGQGSPSGSPQVLVGFGSTAAVVNVYDSASTSSAVYYPPLLVKGTSLTLNHSGGSVGIGTEPGVASTLTAANVIQGSGSISPKLYIGDNVTTTALTANAGEILSRTNVTVAAATISGSAKYTYLGTGAHTTLTIGDGGVVTHQGTGAIATLNVTGTFDRTKDTRAITLGGTAFNIYKGARLLLDNGKASSITRSNKSFLGCSIQDLEITLPVGEQF